MCSSARHRQPSLCARASPENQPIHANHLHTGRSLADGASTIFSRGLPANIDHTSSLMNALLSHTFHFPYSRISQYCKLVEDEKVEDARALKAALRRRHREHKDVPDSESENEVEAYVTDQDDDDDDKLTPSAQLQQEAGISRPTIPPVSRRRAFSQIVSPIGICSETQSTQSPPPMQSPEKRGTRYRLRKRLKK
jgi:hypothetical protein